MVQGNIFAILLIVAIIVCIVITIKLGKRPDLVRGLFAILAVGICFGLIVNLTPVHGCRRGGSIAPFYLMPLCAGIFVLGMNKLASAIKLSGLYVVLGILMAMWGMDLVHENGYVGNPNYDKYLMERIEGNLFEFKEDLTKRLEHKPVVLEKGWLKDVLPKSVEGDFRGRLIGNVKANLSHYWYTFFTGIYKLNITEVDIWCPGGTLEYCLGHLEVKEI